MSKLVRGSFLDLQKLSLMAFTGNNGAGACTATGLVVGDRILSVSCTTAASTADVSSLYETVVTVADQIQQSSATDRSSLEHVALILSA